MTLLEQYSAKLNEMNEKIRAGQLPPEEMLVYQELVYRIAVLNTCKAFCAGAPVTMETAKLCCHYQVVIMYVKMLSGERQVGSKTDEDGKKKRGAAKETIDRVMNDGVRRFSSFNPKADDHYKKTVSEFINAYISVWIQYRNTYINI